MRFFWGGLWEQFWLNFSVLGEKTGANVSANSGEKLAEILSANLRENSRVNLSEISDINSGAKFGGLNKNFGEILNYSILVCVCFYFFGQLSGGFNAIKNIGIYGGIFLCAIYAIKFKDEATANFRRNFSENRTLIVLILAFYFVIFITSIAPYSTEFSSLKAAFKELKKGIFLFIILLFCCKNEYKKWIFYAIILAFVFCVFKNFLPVFSIDSSVFGEIRAIVDRFFSSFFDILSPFVLTAFFILKNKRLKIALFVVFALGICADILTGARGSYLAFILSAFVVLILIVKKREFSFSKKGVFIGAVCGAIFCGALAFGYQNLTILHYKFMQTGVSSRDIIIKQRLPELLNSDRKFIGLGHGMYQYERFFNDIARDRNLSVEYDGYFGPNGGVDKDNGLVKFWHDEPTFLAAYYHYGVFAIVMPVLAFYLFGRGVWVFIRRENYYALGVAMSVFSFYLVRGLFEGYDPDKLFLLAFLMIIFSGEKFDKYIRT